MERLNSLITENVLDYSCKQLAPSSLQQDDRMPHRTQRIYSGSCSYSVKKPFYQQAMWLALLMCCFSVALGQVNQVDVTDSLLSTTASSLDVTTYAGVTTDDAVTTDAVTTDAVTTDPITTDAVTTDASTYSPTPPIFNFKECRSSMDTSEQVIYICVNNPGLFPILKYAESLAKRLCEDEFKNDLWNCSGFSILREPMLSKSGDMFRESAYVYSISLAAIAHTVAKACSSGVIPDCGCEDGESGCLENVKNALSVAESFLNKRYVGFGRTLNLELIHYNLVAAKQHIHYLINTSDSVCKCHGVSGSCSVQTCLPEFPNFNRIASSLKTAYGRACRVVPNGHSRNMWISMCGRNFTDMDLLFRDNFNWCDYRPSVGSLGTEGRECNANSNMPNSCQNLCSRCGRSHAEHYVEQNTKCDCQFHFCCEILCEDCVERRTYYSCSSG